MFLQIHFLTSYPASLLNRDDTGLAKRIPFGNASRIRISSQSQKRHWRLWIRQQLDQRRIPIATGWRTRHFFDLLLMQRAQDELGLSSDEAQGLIAQLKKHFMKTAQDHNTSTDAAAGTADDSLNAKMQGVLFGQPEADYFLAIVRDMAAADNPEHVKNILNVRLPLPARRATSEQQNQRQNLSALLRQAGLGNFPFGFEGALFGRFVTSDVIGTRMDAPVHVAHAFTTHAEQADMDYFTLVDDLVPMEETGAAHVNETELTSGVFYGYVVVDIPQLVANIIGCNAQDWRAHDAPEARTLLRLLIQAIATVTPGAKLGATAPYARAQAVIVEVGTAQPRTLANAFLKPVHASDADSLLSASVHAMAAHLTAMEAMYGPEDTQRWVAVQSPWPREQESPCPLPDAIAASLAAVWPNTQEDLA